ncbi:MAG: 16S rRNA (cytidine(1402)-2'-O)-methyltransferase [Tissierellia bacterium]|nr:16S rRNA (cytidine(1402)-2'-O)-methyltransferase [Tissierellia bacterium]
MDRGILYICPTPIGNLEDITLRTLKVLKEVDLIAAEDTRRTVKLLNHYDIKKPLISYHEHNKLVRGEQLLEKLINGNKIALVTDAGMPGISDPGADIIRLCIEECIEVVALPGPTAFVLALVLSGLPTDRFVFEGFLPSKGKERKDRLNVLRNEKRTIIIYEAPHRIKHLLKDLLGSLGNRQISVSRELTKVYEETFRGCLLEAIEKFNLQEPKGEFVLVVEGAEDVEDTSFDDMSIKEHIKMYMDEGLSKKDSIKKVAKERNIPKNQVYREGIDL